MTGVLAPAIPNSFLLVNDAFELVVYEERQLITLCLKTKAITGRSRCYSN